MLLLSAARARELVGKAAPVKKLSPVQKVLSWVEIRAKGGHVELWMGFTAIDPNTADVLRQLGYSVTPYEQAREGAGWEISWR